MASFKKGSQDKSDPTTNAVRSINAAQQQARDQKTEKLRNLRLAAEAANPPAEVAPVRKRAKTEGKIRQIKV